MSIFDIVLIVVIAGFGLAGLWFGIVHTLISLFGSLVAIFAATRYFAPVSDWLISITGWNPNFSKVVIFIIVFIFINRLVVLAFWILNKFLRIFTGLPIIRGMDRLIGLIFGIFEGALILGVFFYFIARYPVGEMFSGWMDASRVLPFLNYLTILFLPLVSEALRVLRSTVEGLF